MNWRRLHYRVVRYVMQARFVDGDARFEAWVMRRLARGVRRLADRMYDVWWETVRATEAMAGFETALTVALTSPPPPPPARNTLVSLRGEAQAAKERGRIG